MVQEVRRALIDMNFVRHAFLDCGERAIYVRSYRASCWRRERMIQCCLHPPADSWPGYHGDYSGRRHSSLDSDHAAEREGSGPGLGLPDGPVRAHQIFAAAGGWHFVFTVPDNIWAVDARSGHAIWHYSKPTNQGEHIGNRGVAMYKGSLFFSLRMRIWCPSTPKWNRALESGCRRCHQGLLDQHGAARRREPRARRRLRRF